MSWAEREILLVVKTYPSPSKGYGSTVCTAGILEDTNEWVRLYPIRWLRFAKKNLKKFVRFKAEIMKNQSDKRKESHKIRESSIKIVDESLTKASERVWDQRTRIINSVCSKSAEELKEKYYDDWTSLGVIKPRMDSVQFRIRKLINEIEIKEEKTTQYDLLGKKVPRADEIERSFSYKFHCNDDLCNGHDRICEDWELIEAFRKWRSKYPDDQVFKEKLSERFNDWMIKRDLYFIMGTHFRLPSWMIIGLYYPPIKEKKEKPSSIFVL